MNALVKLISDNLIAHLRERGWPPLSELPNHEPGRILVGDTHQFAQYIAPRVIFRPIKGAFSGRDVTRGVGASGSNPSPAEKAAIANPAFLSDAQAYEVACLGICPSDMKVEPRAAELDYDFTEGLYKSLLTVMQAMNANNFKVEGGTWRNVRHNQRVGREFVMTIAIGTPVLTNGYGPPAVNGWTAGQAARWAPTVTPFVPIPGQLPRAPDGTTLQIQDGMQGPATGDTVTPGCEDEE